MQNYFWVNSRTFFASGFFLLLKLQRFQRDWKWWVETYRNISKGSKDIQRFQWQNERLRISFALWPWLGLLRDRALQVKVNRCQTCPRGHHQPPSHQKNYSECIHDSLKEKQSTSTSCPDVFWRCGWRMSDVYIRIDTTATASIHCMRKCMMFVWYHCDISSPTKKSASRHFETTLPFPLNFASGRCCETSSRNRFRTSGPWEECVTWFSKKWMSKVPVVEILSIEVAASFLNGLQFGAEKMVEKTSCGKIWSTKIVWQKRVVSKNFDKSRNLQDEFIGSLLCRIVTRGPTSKDPKESVNP